MQAGSRGTGDDQRKALVVVGVAFRAQGIGERVGGGGVAVGGAEDSDLAITGDILAHRQAAGTDIRRGLVDVERVRAIGGRAGDRCTQQGAERHRRRHKGKGRRGVGEVARARAAGCFESKRNIDQCAVGELAIQWRQRFPDGHEELAVVGVVVQIQGEDAAAILRQRNIFVHIVDAQARLGIVKRKGGRANQVVIVAGIKDDGQRKAGGAAVDVQGGVVSNGDTWASSLRLGDPRRQQPARQQCSAAG